MRRLRFLSLPLLLLLALLLAKNADAGPAQRTQLVLASASCADIGSCPEEYWTLDTPRFGGWGVWKEYYFGTAPNAYTHNIYGEAWYSPSYNASGWDGVTMMRWSDWWTGSQWLPYMPNRGTVAMTYNRGFYPDSGKRAYAHRRGFDVNPPAGMAVKSARLFMWVDAPGCAWVNGNPVGSGCMSAADWGAEYGWQPGSEGYGAGGHSNGSGGVWYTNSGSPALSGRVDTVIGVRRVEGNTGSGWQQIAASTPFTWSLSGWQGQAVLQLRAVDTVGQVGKTFSITLYIDPRGPQTPTLTASANGQGQLALTWEIPPDQGGGSVLQRPDGSQELHTVTTGADGVFTLDAQSSSEADLGCGQVGEWQARARLLGADSAAVAWMVEWFMGHGSQ